MNLILSPHVRFCLFEDQGILLDLKKEKYFLLQDKPLEFLLHVAHHGGWEILEGEEPLFQHNFMTKNVSEEILVARYFLQLKILKIDFTKRDPYEVKYNRLQGGILNLDWRFNTSNILHSTNTSITQCWMALMNARFLLKIRGLWNLIQYFHKKTKAYNIDYFSPTHLEIEALAQALSKACLYFPGTVRCLEWAVAYMLLALKQKWCCNLMIGVQTIPFMAHAWVQCDSYVIFDDIQLPERLSIILNEPFLRKDIP